jgi:hypothetical protein
MKDRQLVAGRAAFRVSNPSAALRQEINAPRWFVLTILGLLECGNEYVRSHLPDPTNGVATSIVNALLRMAWIRVLRPTRSKRRR